MKNEENKQIKNMSEIEFLEFERRQLQCKMGKMLEDNDYNSYSRLVKSYSEILHLKDKCVELSKNEIKEKYSTTYKNDINNLIELEKTKNDLINKIYDIIKNIN